MLDFEGDLYGADVRLAFEERLRDERRFASAEALVAQIRHDVEHARALVSAAPARGIVGGEGPGNERAPGRHARGGGRRAASRRRRRELPAQVLRRHRRVQEPGRHDPLRLARRAGGRAALRAVDPPLGRREGLRRPDPRGDRALPPPARRRSRPGRARRPALREWGTGEAEITGARLLDADGDERAQFLAGEPLRLEVDLAAPTRRSRRPGLHLELRDTTGSSSPRTRSTPRRSAGRPDPGRRPLRLEIDRPPLAFGRFRVRLGLVGDRRPARCTSYDDALSFLVYPDGEERGLVRLGGTWRAGANQEIR